jgi:hypothetical protein
MNKQAREENLLSKKCGKCKNFKCCLKINVKKEFIMLPTSKCHDTKNSKCLVFQPIFG